MSFSLIVEDVFTISGRGIIATGKVQGGPVRVGDIVTVETESGEETSKISSISMFRRNVDRAEIGENVGLKFASVDLRPKRGGRVATFTPSDPVDPIITPDLGRKTFDGIIGDAPALLLPLRIETARAQHHLNVRAYPDTIHIAADARAVSDAEIILCDQFRAALDEGQSETALRPALDAAMGSARASYVLKATQTGQPETPQNPVDNSRQTARCLPQKLFAVAVKDDKVVAAGEGKPIPRALPVSPANGDSDMLRTDRNPIAWLSDFDAALSVGMAVQLPLHDDVAFDRLFVFGLGANETTDKAELADLFAAHNRRKSGIHSPDPGTATKGTAPRGPAPARSTQGASRLAQTLGLNDPVFSGLTPDTDDLRRNFADIVWEAVVRPAALILFDPDKSLSAGHETRAMRTLKQRFMALRPDGQLPLMQIGTDPYGIYVAQTSATKPATGVDPIAAMIATRASRADAARSERIAEEALPGYEPTLSTLIRHDIGQNWRARAFIPTELMFDILTNLAPADVARQSSTILQTVLARRALLAHAKGRAGELAELDGGVFSGMAAQLCGALIGADASTSPLTTLDEPHLIALLKGEDVWQRLDNRVNQIATSGGDPTPVPVLALMVEHLVLRSLAEIEAAHTTGDDAERADLLGHGTWQRDGASMMSRLALAAVQRLRGGSLEDIANSAARAQSEPARAIDLLQRLPDQLRSILKSAPAVSHRVMAGVLDSASHRSDLWQELQAYETIEDQRARGQSGLVVGGYGIIDATDSATAQTRRKATYITAPSAPLASVLAILWRARAGLEWHDPGAQNMLPADLDGAQIAAARPLIAALRRGDDLASALAARVADHLQRAGAADLEAELDRRYTSPPREQSLSIPGFDGLAFLHDTNLDKWRGAPDLIRQAHAALTTSIDALRMVLVAEGAAALAEGRPEAAQAVLAGLSIGAAPADLVVTETKQVGETVSLSTVLAADWQTRPTTGTSLRARLAPELAHLATTLLGPIAGHVDGENNTRIPLATLVSDALDLAWLMAPGASGRALLLDQARAHAGLSPQADIAFDETGDATLWMAARVHAALTGARPLAPADLGQTATEDWRATGVARALARTRETLLKWRAQSRRLIPLVPTFSRPKPRFDRMLLDFTRTTGPTGLANFDALLSDRLAKADAAQTPEDALQALLGDLPLVLPFPVADTAPFDSNTRFKHAGPLALSHWIEESATVRDRLEPLSDLTSARGPAAPLHAVQWSDAPPRAASPDVDWIGGPLSEDDAYPARNSAVIVGDLSDASNQFAGLYLDGWSETLPAARGDIGVVFDVDAPLARAPQTLLLIAREQNGSGWTPQDMADALGRVMDDAQARMLTPTDWPGAVSGDRAASFLGASLPLMMLEDGVAPVTRGFCPPLPEPDR